MFRRIRHKRWLVAGLGVAALVAPTSALAGNHNLSSQAYRALVAKGQAQNQRYAIFAQGQALDERYGNLVNDQRNVTVDTHNMSPQAYNALVAKGQAENQRYAIFAQGQALDDRYGNVSYGAPDGWYPYAVELTTQSRIPVLADGRSPDTVDYAVQAHNPFTASSGSSSRFQWGDFGIGGGVALGAVLLLLLSLLIFRQGRESQTPVAGT